MSNKAFYMYSFEQMSVLINGVTQEGLINAEITPLNDDGSYMSDASGKFVQFTIAKCHMFELKIKLTPTSPSVNFLTAAKETMVKTRIPLFITVVDKSTGIGTLLIGTAGTKTVTRDAFVKLPSEEDGFSYSFLVNGTFTPSSILSIEA